MEGILWLAFTVLVYSISKLVYRKFSKLYLTPLLITPIIVTGTVWWSGRSYGDYHQGTGLLSDMVEPATIALAVILYRNFHLLKKHAVAILASVGFGTLAAIVTTASLAHWIGLSNEIASSLAPRTASTPIAVSISNMTGGLPTITAIATLITGLLGMVLGPLVVKWLRIHHPVARGLMLGTSSHTAGISKALEYGTVSGSIAGIAMILTAFVALCIAPWLITLLQ